MGKRSVWGDAGLLKRLTSLTTDAILPENMAKLELVINDSEFRPDVLVKCSAACAGLCKFVLGLVGKPTSKEASNAVSKSPTLGTKHKSTKADTSSPESWPVPCTADVTELKALGAPPQAVKNLLHC